jgi:hypothetical protein
MRAMSPRHRLLGVVAAIVCVIPTAASAELTADLVFSNSDGADQICLHDSEGEYTCTDLAVGSANARAVAAGDVDGDGNLDVVLAIGPDTPNRVCRGDGAGSFACSNVGSLPSTTASVALGDVDRNGTLDAVFGNVTNQLNHVCLGDGAGSFSCSEIAGETGENHGVAIGDVSGDGNPDLVVARAGKPSQVCLGDGEGNFACEAISSATDDSFGVALGDLNHDGKLDAVFANVERLPLVGEPQHNSVCLGNGAGQFTCHDISHDSYRSTAVALGDLNRDGHLDAVFANFNQQPDQVCLGDGTGDFDCRRVGEAEFATSGVALVDLDGNKTLDIVFASACDVGLRQEPNRACFGDGKGDFYCTNVTGDLIEASGVAVGQFTPF